MVSRTRRRSGARYSRSSSPARYASSTLRRSNDCCVEFRNPARTPSAGERVDLVLHEGDEWGHDDPGALPDQRGDLVAERLAAAGRHEHQRVAAAHDGVDDLGLLAAEGVVPPHGVQHLGGCRQSRLGIERLGDLARDVGARGRLGTGTPRGRRSGLVLGRCGVVERVERRLLVERPVRHVATPPVSHAAHPTSDRRRVERLLHRRRICRGVGDQALGDVRAGRESRITRGARPCTPP